MSPWPAPVGIALFALRFGVFLLVLAPVWWLLLPGYGWLLVQGCGSVLKYVLGMPVQAGRVDVAGILNTGSELVLVVDNREKSMKIALLVTNLPPYLALVLATTGTGWRRRLKALFAGSAILIALHGLYVVAVLRFGSELAAAPAWSTAVSQFLLTLPFLMWLIFAYWGPETARAYSG